MKAFSGRTRVYGIIGDPISHSLSPVFWNAAFSALGEDSVYVPFHVDSQKLGDAVRGLACLSVKGFNVTSPHKESIVKFLSRLQPPANSLRAVNSVKIFSNGEMEGSNTDIGGFLSILKKEGVPKKALLLGAGGAAKAVFLGLCESGVETVFWANRTPGKQLEPDSKYKTRVVPVPWNEIDLIKAISKSELVVNATSLGWNKTDSLSALQKSLNFRKLYIDLNYCSKSNLLIEAKKCGARVIDGSEMLVNQGIESFEFLTGNSAPQEIIRSSVLACLAKEAQ
ncbi:shikimate dehydrogenase [bacterium]|nr:shikimate dehydrogenase [bacterium]